MGVRNSYQNEQVNAQLSQVEPGRCTVVPSSVLFGKTAVSLTL